MGVFLLVHPYKPSTTTRQTASELPTTAVAPVVKPRCDDGCCAAFTIMCVVLIVMVLGVILLVKSGLG
ncbi:hypothetical protein QYE76_036749 [Lolium multiflorum]|uniref:Uncharacterized protein n=1 Tax=Lolium multiflorum TaxID=4521 RepID=A0AAD8R330_LOLMU|nr:hypothetical protein QYE76_036749 [Lolium multiflorum]